MNPVARLPNVIRDRYRRTEGELSERIADTTARHISSDKYIVCARWWAEPERALSQARLRVDQGNDVVRFNGGERGSLKDHPPFGKARIATADGRAIGKYRGWLRFVLRHRRRKAIAVATWGSHTTTTSLTVHPADACRLYWCAVQADTNHRPFLCIHLHRAAHRHQRSRPEGETALVVAYRRIISGRSAMANRRRDPGIGIKANESTRTCCCLR